MTPPVTPTIKLQNTLSRKKEIFEPLDAANVRMYLCGPTVYDRAHLGNARNVIMFDVLYRLLRHVYGADHVTYVRNITDVDDKINARAAESGRTIGEITEETIGWYHDDMGALGNLAPTHEPRATDYVPEMVAMIEGLIASGHGYAAEGHVLFAVDSYGKYGALSGRAVEDMIAGARVEVAPYKRNPMDFVLWKPSDEATPGWPSPWGRGRPGWHIECSAMALALLGESFDIHGGGLDLQFPHHENEIAQSACAHPEAGFARYWLHNEMLQVEGKKMSKSLGNFITVRELLEQGVPGEVIRFVFLSTHYSKPMDWREEKARQAAEEIDYWATTLSPRPDVHSSGVAESSVDGEMIKALADDLNTSLALTRLRKMAQRIDNSAEYLALNDKEQRDEDLTFIASAEFLGIPVRALAKQKRKDGLLLASYELRFSELRAKAMAEKDFSAIDAMKAALVAAGVEVRMSEADIELLPGPDFDPSKLDALK